MKSDSNTPDRRQAAVPPGDDPDLEIQAFIDGWLVRDPRSEAAMRDTLSWDVRRRAKAETVMQQNAQIGAAFNALAARPVPDRLYRCVDSSRRHRTAVLRRVAAAACLLVVGVGAGWGGARYLERGTGAEMAFTAFAQTVLPDLRRPREGGAEAPPPGLAAAFEGLDIRDLGLTELRRSFSDLAGRPALAITYALADGTRVTLLVQKCRILGRRGVRLVEDRDMAASVWQGETTFYALVAPQGNADLPRLAQALRARLHGEMPAPKGPRPVPLTQDTPIAQTRNAPSFPTIVGGQAEEKAVPSEGGLKTPPIPDVPIPTSVPPAQNL